jgi:DNA-binding transcriptional regulator of glucitol operon
MFLVLVIGWILCCILAYLQVAQFAMLSPMMLGLILVGMAIFSVVFAFKQQSGRN